MKLERTTCSHWSLGHVPSTCQCPSRQVPTESRHSAASLDRGPCSGPGWAPSGLAMGSGPGGTKALPGTLHARRLCCKRIPAQLCKRGGRVPPHPRGSLSLPGSAAADSPTQEPAAGLPTCCPGAPGAPYLCRGLRAMARCGAVRCGRRCGARREERGERTGCRLPACLCPSVRSSFPPLPALPAPRVLPSFLPRPARGSARLGSARRCALARPRRAGRAGGREEEEETGCS